MVSRLNVISLVTLPVSLYTKKYIRHIKYKKMIANGDCKQLFMKVKTDVTEIQKTMTETNKMLKNIFDQLRNGSENRRFIIIISICFRKMLPILEIASSIPQKGQHIIPEIILTPRFE